MAGNIFFQLTRLFLSSSTAVHLTSSRFKNIKIKNNKIKAAILQASECLLGALRMGHRNDQVNQTNFISDVIFSEAFKG